MLPPYYDIFFSRKKSPGNDKKPASDDSSGKGGLFSRAPKLMMFLSVFGPPLLINHCANLWKMHKEKHELVTGLKVTRDPHGPGKSKLVQGAAKMVMQDRYTHEADTLYYLLPGDDALKVSLGHLRRDSTAVDTSEIPIDDADDLEVRRFGATEKLAQGGSSSVDEIDFGYYRECSWRHRPIEEKIVIPLGRVGTAYFDKEVVFGDYGPTRTVVLLPESRQEQGRREKNREDMKTDLIEFCENGKTLTGWPVSKSTYYEYVEGIRKDPNFKIKL